MLAALLVKPYFKDMSCTMQLLKWYRIATLCVRVVKTPVCRSTSQEQLHWSNIHQAVTSQQSRGHEIWSGDVKRS